MLLVENDNFYLKEIAISGYEKTIINNLLNKLKEKESIKVDSLGNLIVFKKGMDSSKKVLLLAHIDEVGIQITDIKQDGRATFKGIGSLKKNNILFQKIQFRNNLVGIIVPITTNINEDQRDFDDLCIDFGYNNKSETEKNINIGEVGTFFNNVIQHNDIIISKALDNRLGCSILLKIIDSFSDYKYDTYIVFTVQEEIGLKGAKVIANTIEPDIAIDIDTISVENIEQLDIGKGVCIKISDSLTICNEDLVEKFKDISKKNDIPVQFEVTDNGGTQLGVIDESGKGVKVAGLSIPIKYGHTANSIANIDDFHSCFRLLKNFLEEI